MTKISTLLASTAAVLVLAGAAFAADMDTKAETKMTNHDNGGYTKETTASKKTDAGMVKDEAKTDLDVKDSGASEQTTTVKHTNDAKGLMNKHTSKTKVTKKTDKDGMTKTERKDTVDGKTVSETEVTK